MDREVRKYLIDIARKRATVAYGKAMRFFNYDVSHPLEVDAFADIIGDISIFEAEHNRPMLSSLVVHSNKRTIGKGFYKLAESLGHGNQMHLLKDGFERSMQERCYKYWEDDANYHKDVEHNNVATDISASLVKSDDYPEGANEIPKRHFSFEGVDVDWFQKHLENTALGEEGEKLVIEYEKKQLQNIGYHELAENVSKVADGRGFDIQSWDSERRPKYIEVKCTAGSNVTPFFISSNELAFSKEKKQSFYLYHVFNFDSNRKTAQFNEYRGDLKNHFFFEAIQFSATKKRTTF